MIDGIVYIAAIKDDNEYVNKYVKVGVTKDIYKRHSGLQTGCPFEIEIYKTFPFESAADAYACEKTFHARNKGRRHRGEWFAMSKGEAEEQLVQIQSGALPIRDDEITGFMELIDPEMVAKLSISKNMPNEQKRLRKQALYQYTRMRKIFGY